ncbi:MAG: hypothetical protein R3E79_16430 [Caldilineaceae bacterium]
MAVHSLVAEPTTATRQPDISAAEAQHIAQSYVTMTVDPMLAVVDGARYYSKPLDREIWRFFVRCPHGPVGIIQVDAHSGTVIPLRRTEMQTLQEKMHIAAARVQGRLPIDGQGFVVGEYARRRATSYLGATTPIFVPGEPPRWQVTIEFQMYDVGPFTLGVMDVDAHTGEVIPLPAEQIKQIRERTSILY